MRAAFFNRMYMRGRAQGTTPTEMERHRTHDERGYGADRSKENFKEGKTSRKKIVSRANAQPTVPPKPPERKLLSAAVMTHPSDFCIQTAR